jgi:hypothetical protein
MVDMSRIYDYLAKHYFVPNYSLKDKVIDAVTRLQKGVENYLAHFESCNMFIRFKQSRGPLAS